MNATWGSQQEDDPLIDVRADTPPLNVDVDAEIEAHDLGQPLRE